MRSVILGIAVASISLGSAALAAPVLTLSEGPAPAVFSNGAGNGFTGALGAGSISMDVVGSDLVVTLVPGGALNDIVALQLDTRAGGFIDADMNDEGDGGRRALTSPSAGGNVAYPITPDFGLAIGSFGSVLFELNAGSTPFHLNFLQFIAAQTISIPLASIGNPSVIDFFAVYTSDTGFMSNETLPASAGINAGGNPGFGAQVTVESYNRFVIPEPTTLGLVAGAGLLALRRRSK